MKNIPTLKSHLQEEWDKLVRRAKLANKRKRKLSDPPVEASSTGQDGVTKPDEKRTKTEEPTTD